MLIRRLRNCLIDNSWQERKTHELETVKIDGNAAIDTCTLSAASLTPTIPPSVFDAQDDHAALGVSVLTRLDSALDILPFHFSTSDGVLQTVRIATGLTPGAYGDLASIKKIRQTPERVKHHTPRHIIRRE